MVNKTEIILKVMIRFTTGQVMDLDIDQMVRTAFGYKKAMALKKGDSIRVYRKVPTDGVTEETKPLCLKIREIHYQTTGWKD